MVRTIPETPRKPYNLEMIGHYSRRVCPWLVILVIHFSIHFLTSKASQGSLTIQGDDLKLDLNIIPARSSKESIDRHGSVQWDARGLEDHLW